MPSFSQIDWLSTLKVTLARGLASTLVFVIVLVVAAPGYPIHEANVGFLVGWPFMAVITATIMHFTIKACGYIFSISGHVPIMDLIITAMLFIASLLVACGDPIVYFVNRSTNLLNITGFKIFNFVPLFIIYGQV